MMIRICSWCGTLLDFGEDCGDFYESDALPPITHGICDQCYSQQLAQLDKVKMRTRSTAKAVISHMTR
jgi:hypothetical protein